MAQLSRAPARAAAKISVKKITLPYLIPDFVTATIVAVFVVAVELAIISYIRYRYMDTPFLAAAFQVVVGGVLVFIAGVLIGTS